MMSKIILMVLAAMLPVAARAQNYDWGNIGRYHADNMALASQPLPQGRVVLLGNSITDHWPEIDPGFFADNNLVGRGIGGQTSYQFLVRFRDDVVNLRPEIVVINVATNDIAENNYPYDESRTMGNIMTMTEVSRANGIKVVLTSVLPAGEMPWRREITDVPQKIASLNRAIALYARINGIPYVDYHSLMADPATGAMRQGLSSDGVHPNADGYAIMEAALLPVVDSLRNGHDTPNAY